MKNISSFQKLIILILSVISLIMGIDCFLDLTTEEFLFIMPFVLVIGIIIMYFIIDDEDDPLL